MPVDTATKTRVGGPGGVDYKAEWQRGRLHAIDQIPNGDIDHLGPALKVYADTLNKNRQSLHWQRAVKWVENVFFVTGRQYIDDILVSRLTNSSTSSIGNLNVVQESIRNLPKPTNDLLGRYLETNIALLTENRPRPRVTPKSDRDEDKTAAELSELTLEYLWEALTMPEKMREICRIILNTGVCWLEVAHDPLQPRYISVPETEEATASVVPEGIPGAPEVPTKAVRQVTKFDPETGKPIYKEEVEFGDVVARIVSPFSFHLPSTHTWNAEDMGWVMKEEFVPIDAFKDRILYAAKHKSNKGKFGKRQGWYLENLDKIQMENAQSLPMWWWERITELVEGPGPSIYIGSPDYWEGYVVVRTFDRKPNPKWPKGRTVITAGDQLIYDSPKEVGARAYNPRWPNRWHPYVRFRWEGQIGTVYGRSLVSKLLPKLKRVNSIDTALIMWRRTVPIAAWSAPKGSHVVEDIWTGRPGGVWEWDPRQTNGAAPQPIYPPDFPRGILEERQQQLAEMESIAGTEQILRGERPVGVNSAAMIDILRKQALASRSAILQAWDEALQEVGTSFLQEVIKHVGPNEYMAERLRILAREKHSRISIDTFAGTDLSDNVNVRVDTVSQALVSKEAREAKMIEVLQYLPNIQAVEDPTLRMAILEELGIAQNLKPSGPDIDRVEKMISWIKQKKFEFAIPMVEDDPYIFHARLVAEKKNEGFFDLDYEQQQYIMLLIKEYRDMIVAKEQQIMEAQMAQVQMQQGAGGA